jgi:hypothetical protein
MLENRMTRTVLPIAMLLLLVGCTKKDNPSQPPLRENTAPPAGFSRSGLVWQDIPSNIVSSVRSTAEAKGYDLRQYWDPRVQQEGAKWLFRFQGMMPDPGFSFSITFDNETGKAELIPGS